METNVSIRWQLTKIARKIRRLKNRNSKMYRILLLTNRDSDNVGDQVIEACDISLIKTVMQNLHIDSSCFKINSRAAGIISKDYVETKDPALLKSAEKLIRESDLIIFGGAPLFNYLYQIFYERTATTLELAEKYHKPVIFSAIGIESYHEDSSKCQRLKKTLNFECVKQITTRDGFSYLQQYKDRDSLVIDKVSDPAVFASNIFRNNIGTKSLNKRKKVGLFILRANGFKDNKINFTKTDAATLWQDLISELVNRGYDYELLTSGHFGDEAFIDYLIRNYNIDAKKCVFNINSPEHLISKLSSYDAIVSCRLHPSIIAFSFNIPSIGLIWNSKVSYFYDSIGYGDRLVDVTNTNAAEIADKIEQAIVQGIQKDPEYLESVYRSLFHGIKSVVYPQGSNITPYNYAKLIRSFPPYPGTSEKEQQKKLERKFRRAYSKYNELFEQNTINKKKIKDLQEQQKNKRY